VNYRNSRKDGACRLVAFGLVVTLACLLGGQRQAGAQESTGVAAPAVLPAAPPSPAPEVVKVVMHTAQGDIHLAIEKGRAPITAGNFLRYVDQKRFDNITFYRAMKVDEVGKYGLVQGGLRGDPKRVYPAIAHEPAAVTGLSHVNGAISMAQAKPGTATADFFIIIGDLVSLDGKNTPEDPGYAVFGRVTEGMDVVNAMMALPKSPTAGEGVMKGQMLSEPVKVLTTRREP
jgi:peptidyl-prolyl cis-trans isomerase A (cyclophilin A)